MENVYEDQSHQSHQSLGETKLDTSGDFEIPVRFPAKFKGLFATLERSGVDVPGYLSREFQRNLRDDLDNQEGIVGEFCRRALEGIQ